ncbi:MAG: glycosyltransferase [Candidatus Nanosalina sp.]
MLNYEYPPVGGGTANACRYVLRELGKRDLEVDLVTSSPGRYREEEEFDGVNVFRLDVGKDDLHHWKSLEIARYMVKGLAKSLKLKRSRNYDLVHAWTGFPCGVMARVLRIPYLVSLRGSDVPGYSERLSNIYPFLKPLIKYTWQSAEAVVPNSRDLKELARETLELRMPIVRNGIDTTEFQPMYEDKGEKLQVLTVARLVERKRVQDVIEAVKDIDVSLTVVGEGPMREKLQGLSDSLGAGDKVEFKGQIDHGKMPEVYQNADIFVLPSLKEGMSNTVLEAMASGLPVIVTETGGSEELINGNGSLVPKKSPGEIKKILKQYMKNPEKVHEEGKVSRRKAEDMSWQQVSERYLELYRSCCR